MLTTIIIISLDTLLELLWYEIAPCVIPVLIVLVLSVGTYGFLEKHSQKNRFVQFIFYFYRFILFLFILLFHIFAFLIAFEYQIRNFQKCGSLYC